MYKQLCIFFFLPLTTYEYLTTLLKVLLKFTATWLVPSLDI